jgi:hypothetical protein
MSGRFLSLILILSAGSLLAQSLPEPASLPSLPATLTQEQIRQLFRTVADKDIENDKKLLNYTYTEHGVENKLDGKGEVKSSESKTYEILEIYGDPVRRLIAKDDKPVDAKEAAKEDEKIQKIIDKRKSESDEERNQRLKEEQKQVEDNRQFEKEVADAYTFTLLGIEQVAGRDTYVITADPRPGFEPHIKDAKMLPKFRFKAWIDKDELQWTKLDAECVDTVSFGLFLARIHKGSRLELEQTRVNNEVWLPKHVSVKVDARIALLKEVSENLDFTYRDYKKFGSESKVVPIGEVQTPGPPGDPPQ